ncbi:MAG: hypothetical protein ACRDJO_10510 [Actinomycetota bacterium]
MRPTVRMVLACAAAVALAPAAGPAGRALAAESHTSSIDAVRLLVRSGYVENQAEFTDSGQGSSSIAAWIEVIDRTGASREIGRRSGTNVCGARQTCRTTIRVTVNAMPGECFVAWASTTPTGGRTTTRSSARVCP